MTEKTRMTAIWISPYTYQKLLYVERVLITKNGRSTNPGDVVKELIEFRRNTGLEALSVELMSFEFARSYGFL